MLFNSPKITRLSKPHGTNTSTTPSPFTSTVKVHHIKITPPDITTPNLYYHDANALMNSLLNNQKPKSRKIIVIGITLQPFRREKYPTLTSLSPFATLTWIWLEIQFLNLETEPSFNKSHQFNRMSKKYNTTTKTMRKTLSYSEKYNIAIQEYPYSNQIAISTAGCHLVL